MQTFLDKHLCILRKIQHSSIKQLDHILFPQDTEVLFPVNKLNNSSLFLPKAITVLDIAFLSHGPTLKHCAHSLLKDVIRWSGIASQ